MPHISYTILYHVMPHISYTILYHVMPHISYTILYHVMPHISYTILYHVMPHISYTILYHVMPHISYTILYHVMPHISYTIYLLYGAASFLRSRPVFAASQEIPCIFMEPVSSLPYSQVPATRPYPEPTSSSPHDSLQLPEDPS